MGKKLLMPPNWQIAEAHGKSVNLGRPWQTNQEIQSPRCECCGNIIQKQPLPLCQNTKQMKFMGASLPLYFVFIKYCIFNLMVLGITSSFLTFSWAKNENRAFCGDNVAQNVPNTNTIAQCSGDLVYLSRITTQVSSNESMLRMSLFFLYLLLLIYTRDTLNKLEANFISRMPTYGQFSVLFENLPQRIHMKAQLEEWLEDYEVNSIVLVGSFDTISSFQKLIEAENCKKVQLAKTTLNVSRNSQMYLKIIKQSEETDKRIQNLSQNFMQSLQKQISLYHNDQILFSTAIITLDAAKDAENMIKILTLDPIAQNYPENWNINQILEMKISAAPEPHQIIWKNTDTQTIQKFGYEIISWILLIIILCILALLYQLVRSSIKQQQNKKTDQNLISLCNYLTILGAIFINIFLLFFFCHQISCIQRYLTRTAQQLSILMKYLFSSFFVTGFMTLITQILTRNNVYSSQFGIVETQSLMIIFYCFFLPFIWMINPWAIMNRFKQTFYRNDLFLSQQQANNLMQNIEFHIVRHYADILNLIWLISFYSSLIPISTIFSVVGLSYYYWVNKCNLLWRSSIKQHISAFSHLKIMVFLQFSLVLRPIGQIIFDFWIRNGPSTGSYVCLGISLFYLFLPKKKIFQHLHQQIFPRPDWSLKDLNLGQNYLDVHPILGKKMKRQIIQISKSLQENQLQKFFQQYVSIHQNPSIFDLSYRVQVSSIKGKLQEWKQQFFHKTNKVLKDELIEEPRTSIYQL